MIMGCQGSETAQIQTNEHRSNSNLNMVLYQSYGLQAGGANKNIQCKNHYLGRSRDIIHIGIVLLSGRRI